MTRVQVQSGSPGSRISLLSQDSGFYSMAGRASGSLSLDAGAVMEWRGHGYAPAKTHHADLSVKRLGCLPGLCGRPRDFVSVDDNLADIPFAMRRSGATVGVRHGSRLQRDLMDAFLALKQYAGQPQSLRAVINDGHDAAAWRGIICLVRHGLFDICSRVKVPLPEGARPVSLIAGNHATLLHALAAFGREPRNSSANTVSLAQRFADLENARVNISLRDGRGRTPLHYAALHDNKRAVKALIAAKARLASFDADHETPLSSAIKFGALSCISSLVRANHYTLGRVYRGPNTQRDICVTREKDPEGAIMRVQVERIKRQPRDSEWSALHWAASLVNPGARDALAVLVDSMERDLNLDELNKRLNEKTTASGATPLQISIRARDPEKVRVLLEAGADPNLVSDDNKHPMHVAAAWGHPRAMASLIEHGGSLDCTESVRLVDVDPFFAEHSNSKERREKVDFHPFDTAVRFRNEACAKVILQANDKVTLARLCAVARAGMIDLLDDMLRRAGTDPIRLANQPDLQGRSLIHHAALCDNPDMITYLFKRMRVNLNQPDHRGWLPSWIAERIDVWRRFQDLGAEPCTWRHTVTVYGN